MQVLLLKDNPKPHAFLLLYIIDFKIHIILFQASL